MGFHNDDSYDSDSLSYCGGGTLSPEVAAMQAQWDAEEAARQIQRKEAYDASTIRGVDSSGYECRLIDTTDRNNRPVVGWFQVDRFNKFNHTIIQVQSNQEVYHPEDIPVLVRLHKEDCRVKGPNQPEKGWLVIGTKGRANAWLAKVNGRVVTIIRPCRVLDTKGEVVGS